MSQPSGGSGVGGGAQAAGPAVASQLPALQVDIQLLAEKVYRLFMEDLRIQQGRSTGSVKGNF